MEATDTRRVSSIQLSRRRLGGALYAVIGLGMLAALFVISQQNFLLFQGLAELFSISVAWSVFFLVWNTRRIVRNDALIFLGTAYFFIGFIDLLHTLAYKGMGVFPESMASNLATQLWIGGRSLEALSLILFSFLHGRRMHPRQTVGLLSALTLLLLLSIFAWNLFPDCYVDGRGLTVFKKASEYVICLMLGLAILLLFIRRERIDATVFQLLISAMALTIFGELAFTLYVSVYGLSNVIGHFLKILSFFLIYLALVRSSLNRPYETLFAELEREKQALGDAKEALAKHSKHLEEMVKERTASLEEAQAHMLRHEKLAVLGQLAGGVGHELRNPLGAIKKAAYFLAMALEGPEEEVRNTLEILSREVANSEEIIQSLFDLADPQNPRAVKDVVLNDLFREALSSLDTPSHIEVQEGLDPGLPGIACDKGQMKQVIRNLFQNAVQAMREGGTLTVRSSRTEDGCVEVTVSDTGEGIPKNRLDTIFEPFFTTKAKGIGLGLALCKSHVEAHGGTITVESEEGKGGKGKHLHGAIAWNHRSW